MPRVNSGADIFRKDATYGFLPFGSTSSEVLIQEPLTKEISNTTAVSEVGSSLRYDGGMQGDGDSGIHIDMTVIAGAVTALNLEGQLRFEVSREWLDYYDFDDNQEGKQVSSFEYILTFAATNDTGAARTLFGAAASAALRLTPNGGSAMNTRALKDGFVNDFVQVHLVWDATNVWLYLDGQKFIDGATRSWGATDMSHIWIGMDRGNTVAKNFGNFEPYAHKIRNVQIAKIGVTWGSVPTNYLGFFGDSYVNLAQDDYTSNVWNGYANSYNGRTALQIAANMRLEFGVDLSVTMHAGGGGHTISADQPTDTLWEDIGTYLANNCHINVLQASTNDAKAYATDVPNGVDIAHGLPEDFESSLKRIIEAIMGQSNAKALILSNTPSLGGRSDLRSADWVKNVSTLNAITKRMPDWWDKTHPDRAGRVIAADLFKATGGEMDPKKHKNFFGQQVNPAGASGSLYENDLHLSCKGYRIASQEVYWPAIKEMIRKFG